MTVHVVGNLCIDTALSVPRFPVVGETLVACAAATGLGGKGVNQAVAAVRAGARVVLHAALGDGEADDIASRLAQEHSLALRLTRLAGPSDTSTILVRPDGENMIVSTTRCAQAFAPAERAEWADCIAAGDILLMQGNLTSGSTAACLSAGRRRGAVTVFNASPLWHARPPGWGDVDWLVVNEAELAALSGDHDYRRGADILRNEGVGAIAVTLGGRGAYLCDASGGSEVTAPHVEAHDTSGAGDVFCGVFVAHLARATVLAEGLARAVSAASLSVTRAGALASCPTADELADLPAAALHRSFR